MPLSTGKYRQIALLSPLGGHEEDPETARSRGQLRERDSNPRHHDYEACASLPRGTATMDTDFAEFREA